MWDAVSEMFDEIAASEEKRLTSADVMAICDILENASASADRSLVQGAGDALEKGFRLLLAAAPEGARAAALGEPVGDESGIAFTLGQINFAQAFAARAFERRVDETFAATIVDQRYERIVRALAERSMSGVDLAERIGGTEETVSRKMRVLRSLGIADYRRQGNKLVNFLTPPAAAVVKGLNLGKLPPAAVEAAKAELEARGRSLEPHLQNKPTFEAGLGEIGRMFA